MFRDGTKQDIDRDGWNNVLYHWMIDAQCGLISSIGEITGILGFEPTLIFYSWYSHKTDVYYVLLYCGN